LEAIEIRNDAFDSDYNAQKATMEEYISGMKTLANQLQDGKHVEAANATERLNELKQQLSDLLSGAESFKFALELAQTREEALVKALKMFNTQHGRTNAWCDACTVIVASDDYSPGAGTDLRSIETAIDMYKFKCEAPSTSHKSKLKQLQTLHDQITDGKHASGPEVTTKLNALSEKMNALTDASSTYKTNLEDALTREYELDQNRKDFDSKADQLSTWLMSVSREIGTTKAGKRRRGSVLAMPTTADANADANAAGSNFTGIGVGVGYDHVEHKLDVFKSEYVSQVESYNLVAFHLTEIAETLETGMHLDAADCTEQQEQCNNELSKLKARAQDYLKRLNEALEREAALNNTLQHFHTKSAGVETWLDTIDQMLGEEEKVGRRSSINPNELKLDLRALDANMALLDAEYGQNRDRMQNVELNSLQEYCAQLSQGKHDKAPESMDRYDGINLRMQELPERAEQYKNSLVAAIDTENDYLQHQKELANKVNEFQFLCKQLGQSATSPLAGLVFSVVSAEEALEKHQTDTAAQLEEIESKFGALQEVEAYLESIKPNATGKYNTQSKRESVHHVYGKTL